jgi:Tfp pilus assembly protein PilZ
MARKKSSSSSTPPRSRARGSSPPAPAVTAAVVGSTRDAAASEVAAGAPLQAELRAGSVAAPAGQGDDSDAGLDFEIITDPEGSGRRQTRVRWGGTVEVRGVFSGALHGGTSGAGGSTSLPVKDVSLGGVFVESAHLFEIGDPVVLSFPVDGGKRLVVNGRVRWVTPFGRLDDPTPGMGIEFVGLDTPRRDRLEALLRQAQLHTVAAGGASA